VTTLELDGIAEQVIRSAGATPSFLGYGRPPYPATTCISVNDEVVHGIPVAGRPRRRHRLRRLRRDPDGWHGDSAFSAIVAPDEAPDADPSDVTLIDVTEQAMWHGIAAIAEGNRLVDIGAASRGLRRRPVRDRRGVRGARHRHRDAPGAARAQLSDPGPRPKLRPGICLAIEPMLTMGDPETRVQPDQWTGSPPTARGRPLGAHRGAHRERALGAHARGTAESRRSAPSASRSSRSPTERAYREPGRR
jgi:methionyl aminopeptidase